MRKLIHDFFGTDWENLSFSDIEKFFSVTRQESQFLESKSYHSFSSQFNELVESIVAMLNAEGGLIVYGGPPPVHAKSEDLQTTLQPITESLDDRTLQQKFYGRIEPYPSGIECKLLKGKKGSVLLILVNRSATPPYMAKEKGYLYRVDRHKRIAPHHYVEALMKKHVYPNILFELYTFDNTLKHTQDRLIFVQLGLNFSIKNKSIIHESNLECVFSCVGIRYTVQRTNLSFETFQGGRQIYQTAFFRGEPRGQIASQQLIEVCIGIYGKSLPLKCSKYRFEGNVNRPWEKTTFYENVFATDLTEEEQIGCSVRLFG